LAAKDLREGGGQILGRTVLHAIHVKPFAAIPRILGGIETVDPLLGVGEVLILRRDDQETVGLFHRDKTKQTAQRRAPLFAQNGFDLGDDVSRFRVLERKESDREARYPIHVEDFDGVQQGREIRA